MIFSSVGNRRLGNEKNCTVRLYGEMDRGLPVMDITTQDGHCRFN